MEAIEVARAYKYERLLTDLLKLESQVQGRRVEDMTRERQMLSLTEDDGLGFLGVLDKAVELFDEMPPNPGDELCKRLNEVRRKIKANIDKLRELGGETLALQLAQTSLYTDISAKAKVYLSVSLASSSGTSSSRGSSSSKGSSLERISHAPATHNSRQSPKAANLDALSGLVSSNPQVASNPARRRASSTGMMRRSLSAGGLRQRE